MGAPKAYPLQRAHDSRSSSLHRERKREDETEREREIGAWKTSDYSNKKIACVSSFLYICFILC